ncbi:MAG TPA: amidohydrolase family protein [Solirubrobacterales bacterium]|nr:amidohydrolase family protein [Solirubrobacterales bacterium]
MDLAGLRVVDGHCHPFLRDPWQVPVAALTDLFSEGRPGTMGAHIPHTGYFQRAIDEMARRLGTIATPEAVLERRLALGPAWARQAMTRSGLAALLVDTGYPPEAMSLDAMRRIVPCAIHEVFRVETCAERLLRQTTRWSEFQGALRVELQRAAGRCVAFKSIIAYRSGLAVRHWTDDEAAAAYAEALERVQRGGSSRLTDKRLLDTLFETTLDICIETGRPLQVHAGFGDPDIDLLQANPLLLRPILEDSRRAGLRIVVLHMAYPYVREAAFMTAVWPQVFLDLSLALPFLGPAASGPLVEILGLAPATKLLYGSDVGAVPDLFALAADWGRATLGEALDWLVSRGGLSPEHGAEAARLILSDNAERLYGIRPE